MKNSFRRTTRLASPALMLACGSALAQSVPSTPALARLDAVVVTATRSAVPLRDVLADVTLIGREELERHGTGGLADVLRGVPGFEMVRSGGPGGTTSMFVRGAETRFTAVLIDGLRVDTQTTGGATWEAIPLSQIDRIEILRGPGSSVYGSDAIGGVVQIFTRRGEQGTRFDVGVTAGSMATLNADVGVSGATGPFDYAVSALSQDTRGYNAKSNGNPDLDGYKAQGGSARVGLKLGDAHRVDVSLLRNRLDAQYDGFTPGRDDHALHTLETARAGWTAQWTRDWTSALNIGQSTDHYETVPDPYATKTRIRTATLQNDLRFGAHSVNATVEHRDDALENSSLLGSPERNLTQNAVALGYGWRAGAFGLQANARHDRFSEYGSKTTGSIAAGLDVGAGFRIQSSVGNAFRAPTLYQRFTEYGPTTEALRPERSRSNVEFALHHRAGAFASSITAYRNRISDLIVFTSPLPAPAVAPCPGTFGCYSNVGNAMLQGVTLASNYAADGWRVRGSLDLQSPKNLDTGKRLARRSKEHAALGIDRDLGNVTLGAQWLAFGQRFENAANTTKMRSYSVLNLDAQYRFAPDWRLQGRIDNVFDRQYETARTYNAVPLSFYLGLRWTPKL